MNNIIKTERLNFTQLFDFLPAVFKDVFWCGEEIRSRG